MLRATTSSTPSERAIATEAATNRRAPLRADPDSDLFPPAVLYRGSAGANLVEANQ